MKLSEHFLLEEFTRSQTASRKGIANVPPQEALASVRRLVDTVLEPARTQLGKAMNIDSGYRSPELNKAIGGSNSSQHMWTASWAAADVEMFGLDNLVLARWIEANCDSISSFASATTFAGAEPGWVNVSTRTNGKNRRKALT